MEVKVHHIKKWQPSPPVIGFHYSKYPHSLCRPVRIYTDCIFLSFKLKAKEERKWTETDGGKKFPKSCSFWTRHTHNSLYSMCQLVRKVKISECCATNGLYSCFTFQTEKRNIGAQMSSSIGELQTAETRESRCLWSGSSDPVYPGVSFYIYGSPKVRKRRSCKFLQYPPVTS